MANIRTRVRDNYKEKEIWTLGETADFLTLSEETTRRLAKVNEIPGKKIGSRWVFNQEKIRAFLETI